MEDYESLIIRACSGNIEAFAKLIQRFQDMAYGYAYSILGDFQLAEDVAQEAFIDVYAQLPNLRKPSSFPGWLRRIVFKHCDRITRHKGLETVPLRAVVGMASENPDPAQVAEQNEIQDKVLHAIRNLPEHQRMVTTLFYINGYTQREVADFLEVPLTTVKKRLYDSKEKLRENMIDMIEKTLKKFPLPGDFADVVVRIVSSEDDLKRLEELMGHTGSIAEAQNKELFVVGEKGKIESAGQLGETIWCIGTTIIKAARSGFGVAGESDGVPDPMFVKGYQGHFKLAKENGIRLALVHGSQYDHAFCGFVPCFYYALATLPCKIAKSVETTAILRKPHDKDEEKIARDTLDRDPYRTRMCASPVRVVEHKGVPEGYVYIDGNGNISTMTLKTREAALLVIRLMAEETDRAGGKEIGVMESHMTIITQTMLRLGGKYLLRPSCDLVGLDAEMAAIIDLVGLTRDLQNEFETRINASPAHHINGGFSIEMIGIIVGFVVESGNVKIVTEKQKIHRILPRWVITRLYMGYYSGEDVLNIGPIPYDRSDGKTPDDPKLDMQELKLPENEAKLFRALFPKLWPCSTPDPDVWPWVIGEEGPRYQHEDEKTPEMKAQIDSLRFPWIGY